MVNVTLLIVICLDSQENVPQISEKVIDSVVVCGEVELRKVKKFKVRKEGGKQKSCCIVVP